jgi:hypothetical protein
LWQEILGFKTGKFSSCAVMVLFVIILCIFLWLCITRILRRIIGKIEPTPF